MQTCFFIILTFIMTFTSNGQTSKETDFAQKITEAFKSKSFDNYKKLTSDKNDFEEFIADIQKNSLPGVNSDKWIKSIREYGKEVDSTFKTAFDSLTKEGNIIGIDRTEVKFKKFAYRTDNPANFSKTILRGYINFTYKDTTYVLFGLEALELSSGYKISFIRAVNKGEFNEYVNPDVLEYEDE